ncbi:MAG: 2,3-dihydro-2,3-dihydroxybenzoate synthetase [Pseudonocardia sp. SCN 72-86]|nr:MAG: 2,3-dihydro-2,3-dihydroxybenzoate synthetase [Pseudonocardia sp. SCN 72-86]
MADKALPRVASYEPPDPAGFPAGRVGWTLDPGRAALLVHDMQKYFLAPYADDAQVAALVSAVADVVADARRAGVPVFYTAQPGVQSPEDRGLLTDMWGEGIGAVVDTRPELEEIVDALAPRPGDVRLVKWRYSAFQRTDLSGELAARGRDQLLITGIYASIGCLATAVEAFMRDVQPFMVGDAVADFSRDDHDHALDYVARRAGVVTSVAQVRSALGEVVAAGGRR